MNLGGQIVAVTVMNMRSLPQRMTTSLVVVVGIAGVVAVLISVLSLATGLTRTLSSTGRAERVIILYSGAQSEVGSNMTREVTQTLTDLAGIKKDSDGKPIVSVDATESMWLHKATTGGLGTVTFR